MATRPSLNIAVQGTKNTATKYNENFEMMMDFIDDSLAESKTYVDSFMPSVTGQSGKFLTNDGTDTSWVDIFGSNNTFTGNNTFSGNVTISGGTFDFPKCTTEPTTTSTASNTLPAVVVENYLSGKSGCIVFSDKLCIQYGMSTASSGHNKKINLLKPYANTNYNIQLQQYGGGTGAAEYQNIQFVEASSVKTSSFEIYIGPYSNGTYWCTYGYLA